MRASTLDGSCVSLRGRDLLSIDALTREELVSILATAEKIKRTPSAAAGFLAGRSVVCLFEKPSLRTRVSFQVGITRLGGHAMDFDHSKERLGVRESIRDAALNLERFFAAIVARVHDHGTLEELARHAGVPVINALSDRFHPCQALADVLTLRERLGEVRGRVLTYLGDGNNVCHSLVQAGCLLGMHVQVVTPRGCEPDAGVVSWSESAARAAGGSVRVSQDAGDVRGSDAVYTDSWVSMGQEARTPLEAFRPLQVNAGLMRRASEGRARGSAPVVFLHCLPATRGNEVTDEVIDSTASAVYDQAENRMHAQNALLLHLLAPVEPTTMGL